MRQLKFRIWDGNNRHFDYPDIIELDRGLEYQQFTGLFDQHGKEIFEGDVVIIKNGRVFIIEWRDMGFYGKTFNNGKWWFNHLFANKKNGLCYCIVIGNVYENPGLPYE